MAQAVKTLLFAFWSWGWPGRRIVFYHAEESEEMWTVVLVHNLRYGGQRMRRAQGQPSTSSTRHMTTKASSSDVPSASDCDLSLSHDGGSVCDWERFPQQCESCEAAPRFEAVSAKHCRIEWMASLSGCYPFVWK